MSIEIILGCMYSGKTSEVIKECRRWQQICKNALCINFENDNRYGDDEKLYNHDLNYVRCVKVLKLEDVDNSEILNSDIILINEAQFFPDLVEYCLLWCEKFDKKIIVSGLDGDYKRNKFGHVLELIPYCDSVTKLNNAFCTMCKNGTVAYFTWRLSGENDQIVIGSDNYIPLCRKHYIEMSNKQN